MSSFNFLITNILSFGAVLAILLLRLIRKRPQESEWIISYPIAVQMLAAAGLFLAFTGASMLAELSAGLAAKIFVVILSAPAAVAAFMIAAEVFVAETGYNESALYRCTPWRRELSVPFDDVVRIEKSPLSYNYAFHSSDGKVIRVFRWTERSEDVLAYAEEGLDDRDDLSRAP